MAMKGLLAKARDTGTAEIPRSRRISRGLHLRRSFGARAGGDARGRSPARPRRPAAALGLAALLATSGCSLFRTYRELERGGARGDALVVKAYPIASATARPRFVAGAASRDITPPPGYPTGGHGPAGAVARGYWMRLEARAFFFLDRAGRPLALVSADLFAVPAGLQADVARRAAEELARRDMGVALPPEAVVLAATHAHHGPGNFMTSGIYNRFGSPYPGFDPELFEFLSKQISGAIVAAALDARAHPDAATLRVRTYRGDHGLLLNRAPRTFVLNQDRDDILAALDGGDPDPECRGRPGEPQADWDLAGCPRLRAVDRTLTVVTVERAGGSRPGLAAVLLFLSAHPTVLQPDTPLYSPDFTGYATVALERRLGDPGRPVVVGFFNGAEGDVVARRTGRDLQDVERLGTVLEDWVVAALAAPGGRTLSEPDVLVRAGKWRPSEPEENACVDASSELRLASAPVMGAAALGGAEGDWTVLHDLGARDGVRDRPLPGQGVKQPALDSQVVRALRFTSMFAPPEVFPEAIPLVLADLGDLRLAAVPAELTTAQGHALRKALGGAPRGTLEVVGLANEYVSYASTADEYVSQDYAGASTLWGPAEGDFIACRLRELAGRPAIPPRARVAEQRFWPGPGPRERFGPGFAGGTDRPDAGLEKVLLDARGLPERRLPWFAWREGGSTGPGLAPGARRVAIWERGSGAWRPLTVPPAGAPDDDRGPGLVTVHLGDGHWSAIWRSGLERPGQGPFAFVAVTATGELRCSAPFPAAPRREPVAEAADCSSFTRDAVDPREHRAAASPRTQQGYGPLRGLGGAGRVGEGERGLDPQGGER
jgi:neutral ceramidase